MYICTSDRKDGAYRAGHHHETTYYSQTLNPPPADGSRKMTGPDGFIHGWSQMQRQNSLHLAHSSLQHGQCSHSNGHSNFFTVSHRDTNSLDQVSSSANFLYEHSFDNTDRQRVTDVWLMHVYTGRSLRKTWDCELVTYIADFVAPNISFLRVGCRC